MAAVDVQAYDDLDAVAADAAGALDRAAQPSLFARLDWYRLTLALAAPPGRPLVLRGDAGGTRAWLFLMIDGTEATALASWYTLDASVPRVGPDEAESPECLEAVADALRRYRPTIAHLALAPLTGGAEKLRSAFRRAGWRVAVVPATASWRVDTRTGWDAYWSARPARLRETVRRKGRGDPLRIAILDRFDPAAWAGYETVYARSWKPAEGSPAFLRALAEQEGAAGTLRLGLAYDGDRPVAAQLWLVEDGIATIHKLAHDEAEKGRSPGTLLAHAMFRRAIEVDRVRTIDFGTGDDAYKRDWMDMRATLHRLDAWNLAHPLGMAGWLRHEAGQLVHRLRRR